MSKKNRTIPVHSMRDLIEIVNHNADILVKNNRRLQVFCVVTIGYAVYAAIKAQKQEEEIYRLSVKVKKLEHSEEE